MIINIPHFYLNIAGYYIEINIQNIKQKIVQKKITQSIFSYYKGFFLRTNIPNKADFKIVFIYDEKPSIIMNKTTKLKYIFYYKIRNKTAYCSYRISMLQLELVLHNILHNLLKTSGIILHSSSVCIKNKAYLFTGRPGIGKSTIMKILSSKYQPIADDSIIIKKENNYYYCYQTPFIESNSFFNKNKEKFEIGKIFFPRKSTENRIIQQKNNTYNLDRIITQTFIFYKKIGLNKENVVNKINFISEFVRIFKNEFYILYFSKQKRKLLQFFETI